MKSAWTKPKNEAKHQAVPGENKQDCSKMERMRLLPTRTEVRLRIVYKDSPLAFLPGKTVPLVARIKQWRIGSMCGRQKAETFSTKGDT